MGAAPSDVAPRRALQTLAGYRLPMPSDVPTARPTAIDLFSGAGGMTQGLKDAGFLVVAGVEVDSLAAETYGLNHPEVELLHEDIRTVNGAALLARAGVASIDLLAGCPPCQGFSSLTTLNGHRGTSDSRNDLVLEYGRLVAETKPSAVLMENVPGLASDARMHLLIEMLEGLGYTVHEGVRILNAADFGVPQRRRRLVMLAGRHTTISFPLPNPDLRTVKQAIGHLRPAGKSGDKLHDLPERRSERVRQLIAAIPRDGGSRLDLGNDQQLACHTGFDGFKDVYGRLSWDSPAPTITSGCFNPSKGRFLHPIEDRAITMREAALLQTFPHSYKFSLQRGKTGVASMIGNALPPMFVAAHARAALEALMGRAAPKGSDK